MNPRQHDRSLWLVLLFVSAGVIVPTACVLWFMNEAAATQAAAARSDVSEAYRGQLRLLRDRLDSYWQARASALDQQAGDRTPADFERIVTSGLADSVIFPAYPELPGTPQPDPLAERLDWRAAEAFEQRGEWMTAAAFYARIGTADTDASISARAFQAQIRCLFRAGNKTEAASAISAAFNSGPASTARDPQGRLIAADERLLATRMFHRNSDLRRLAAMLRDYKNVRMPSAQRLFLMQELAPETFPTLDAERLAAQVLETGSARFEGMGLERTAIAEVWKLGSAGGHVIALYRTPVVAQALNKILDSENRAVRFELTAPGAQASTESVSAGKMLPGWQLGFTLVDTASIEAAARRRRASYLWIGSLVVAVMAFTGLLLGRALRRQMRLALLKTDLVAAVSHELKTPLASVSVLVDSLLEETTPDPRKLREYLELIAAENTRLTRVVENFLAFARIERRRQHLQFSEIHPATVVQSAVQVLRERKQPVNFNIRVDPELPRLRADSGALVTVLLNLLDNAEKYSPTDKRIAIAVSREGPYVTFAVEDHGIGIEPREQRRIFRSFYQVDRRLARDTGGCGLGLSIVDFIVRAHGGKVRVRSEPGYGSTFSVLLPCSEF